MSPGMRWPQTCTAPHVALLGSLTASNSRVRNASSSFSLDASCCRCSALCSASRFRLVTLADAADALASLSRCFYTDSRALRLFTSFTCVCCGSQSHETYTSRTCPHEQRAVRCTPVTCATPPYTRSESAGKFYPAAAQAAAAAAATEAPMHLLQSRLKGSPASPATHACACLLYTSPSPRDRTRSRMPSSA